MIKLQHLSNPVLGALTVEMAIPRIAASAQRVMHPAHPRRLVTITEKPIHGYTCSWCGCRFPETDVPTRATLGEDLLHFEAAREKRFTEHVCSDRPHVKHKRSVHN